jgi:thiamine biosynthesis lipoprotein ApbE
VQTDLTSVTVICDGGLKSDQLSTSVFIGGTKKLGEYFADKSLQLIAVDTQGNVHISSSLENKITLQKSGHKIIVEK